MRQGSGYKVLTQRIPLFLFSPDSIAVKSVIVDRCVMPAMRAGFDVAMRVAYGRAYGWYRPPEDVDTVYDSLRRLIVLDHVGETGLETFTEREIDTVAPMRKTTLPYRSWSPLMKERVRVREL